jgi:hypothetical protein
LDGASTQDRPSYETYNKIEDRKKVSKGLEKELPRLKRTIDDTKLLIPFLDIIEEHKDLEIQEWNFRAIQQQHLNTLLD